jgi:hypothetical protein
MALPAPAVANVDWLEPDELYLCRGGACEIDRPLFQGDVFCGVPLPALPTTPPAFGKVSLNFAESLVMLLPHPCQCYHGDRLRSHLTVAPVTEVPNYDTFGPAKDRAFDKFALPDLLVTRDDREEAISHLASFGRMVTVPKTYLSTSQRIACLSHMGLGLLAKRLIRFQLRMPANLSDTMVYTAHQWNEAFIMQAWVRRFKSLEGYSDWMSSPQLVPSLNASQAIVPNDYVTGALDDLLDEVGRLSG